MSATYTRTATTLLVIATCGGVAASDLRLEAWDGLHGFFQWMETTLFGRIGKTWGAAFAVVEACHLVGLALLGGAVLMGDGRLLNLWFSDQPCEDIHRQTHRVFSVGLFILLATGLFMACGVAMKLYYLPVFWYKMLALSVGLGFTYGVRNPLLNTDLAACNPWILRIVAISSMMVWFTVAATGRWIGFSG